MASVAEQRKAVERARVAVVAAADLNSYLLSTEEGEQDMKLVVAGPGGDRVFAVPRAAVQRLVEVLEALGDGQEPSVVPMMKELSTGDVASLLGVSRQYVVRLIDEGRLPCRRVGNRRRVRLDEALRYLREDNQRRAGRLRELAPTAS
jgi:excisionase family DNA binding protein